ncbi:SRPBCC family protein [Agromyces aerolatus]|uniref:SRPBCC family protein n=1 Tax=Agromyces sp. LY-1074 TaxID=3074080 RepID=UPI002863AC13|nr:MULTISPECIES: SRPBCC family protein [unclassified Agromyces]MDR5698531.1 SRPBCC family protein [Agromyces sp. LY-1074]MDR5704825.1 SRPBCC family protein [Agromyces sp. LY-1358]
MARNVRVMNCPPEAVFEVLADAWLYPSWVVGASRMRDVDEAWPAEGARLHHSVGAWPLVIDDETRSLEWEPPHRMRLRAKGWPLGEAHVVIDVKPRGDGCVVRIQEEAVEGPGSWVPRLLTEPALRVRNAETLHRLAYLAEGRHRTGQAEAEPVPDAE